MMAITKMSGDFDVNSLEGSGLKHSPSEEYIRDEVIKDVLLNGLRADPSTCNEAQLRFVVQQKTSKKNQWNHTKKELLKWVHRNMSEIKREDIELIVQDPELDPDDLPEESDEEGSEFGEDDKEFSGLNDPSGVSGNELGSDTHGESTNHNIDSSKNNITSKNNNNNNNDASTKVNQKSSSDRKTSDGKTHKKEKSSILKFFSFNTSTSKNTQNNNNNNSNSKDMKFDDTSNSNDQDANSAKDQSKSFTDQDSEFSVQKSPEERLSLLQQRLERLEASYLEELESIKNEMSALSKIIITNSNSNTNQSSTEQEVQEKSIAEETFSKKSSSHTKDKETTKESHSRSSIIVEEDNKKKLRSTSLSHSARATPVSVNDDVACSSQSVSVLPSISQK